MQYNTSRLEISDLSYCELAAEEEAEITGGFILARSFGFNFTLYTYLTRGLSSILPSGLEGYNKKEMYSEPGTVVNKLENPQTGSSGVEVVSNNGNAKSHSVVLKGSNSMTAFSTSTVSNSSGLLST
ncbi:hypothetical protein NIES4071_74930 [Calothrix sp. NIES-4071]|nr:hypothetical protein NIES4071_74930 [Calothrix sp. NIES-4071]BAZ61768.1 hypothetical protein NIES4105_74880 [Calothrix sp. NIES-4105]